MFRFMVVVVVAFCLLSGDIYGQQFSLQGSAIQTGPVTYQLTPDLTNQAGMATNYYPLNLTTNFTVNFQMNFGTKDATGADGIAFMLSNTCNPTLVNGQGLGVANTPNSIVVDFDTWDNGTGYNDLVQDHSGIYGDGNFSVAGNIMDGTTIPVCLLPSCGNVEDGTWYDASIQWEYLSPTSQRISVFFNGVLLSASTQNHIASRFNNNTTVFWSLAASTGGSSNVQQFRVLSANNTYTYCPGDVFTLTAPALGTNYTWSGNSSTSNTATYTASTSGVITCSFINFCGISQSVSFTINVTQLSIPSVSNNGPVCTGSDGNFVITGVAGYTVTYALNGGAAQTIVLNGGTATINLTGITSPQAIALSQITDGICTRNISVVDTIRLKQLAPPTVSNDGPVCEGSDGHFIINGTPGYTASYSIDGGSVQTVSIGPGGTATVTVSAITGTHDIKISLVDDGSCTAVTDVRDTIRTKPLPNIPGVSGNGPICFKNDAVFTLTGNAGEIIQYTVNGGLPSTASILSNGTAQVIVSNVVIPQSIVLTGITGINGCTRPLNQSSTVSLQSPVRTTVDTSICQGLQYFGYYNTGIYMDTFPATNTCDSIRTLNLTVIKTTRPKLGPARVICPGDTIILSPGLFPNYLWQDGSTQPTYTVTSPGLYSVSVNATCGSMRDDVLVSLGVCDIYFPSGFSPNKDGRNEKFKVLTDLPLSSYELKIFDRWGQVIFETTNQSAGWDGTLGGTDLNPGIYIYIASYVYKGEKRFHKGTVMLVR